MISFVICGVEHSGTTLISDLFRQDPNVDSGFEVGVLLGSSPRRFLRIRPYAKNILRGWNITHEDLERCCDTDSFEEFYVRLRNASRALKPNARIFDKTPRYMAHLDSCLGKVSAPFVVTYKDPRAIVFSDFKRAGLQDFDRWFEGYAVLKLGYLRQLYMNYQSRAGRGRRVLRISLEHLCLNPRTASELIFSHCGENFSIRHLLFESSKFLGDRGPSISPSMPFEYLTILTNDQIRLILQTFSDLDEWFYN